MDKKKLDEILANHKLWKEDKGGKKANLRGANLQGANLRDADLCGANLQGANLQEANLMYADLIRADLENANLQGANLQRAYLQRANLQRANLQYANLCNANLQEAILQGTNLQGAYLHFSNLLGTNLSQVKNSPFFDQYDWLCKNFEKDREGFFVYKKIGNTEYKPPKTWKIEQKEFIEEEVELNRTNSCGCGVNFGNKDYVLSNYIGADLWLCKLYFRDLINTCVPIYTDGKARCGRLQLLRKIEK